MPQPCKTCHHPSRDDIEAEVLAKQRSQSAIAHAYGLTPQSLGTHIHKHMKGITTNAPVQVLPGQLGRDETVNHPSRDDIPVDMIDPSPDQPRKDFAPDAMADLETSMSADGLLQPIMVRPGEDGRFIVIHGERRVRAAKHLEWSTIPAIVREVSPEEARWLTLAENLRRADLNPMEEAHGYQGLADAGYSHAQIAQRLGTRQDRISRCLSFLTLPEEVRQGLIEKEISEGHAVQLLRLKTEPARTAMFRRAVQGEFTVRRVKQYVDETLQADDEKARRAEWKRRAEEGAKAGEGNRPPTEDPTQERASGAAGEVSQAPTGAPAETVTPPTSTGSFVGNMQVQEMVDLLDATDTPIDEVLLRAVFEDLEDWQIIAALPAKWVQACLVWLRVQKQEQDAEDE